MPMTCGHGVVIGAWCRYCGCAVDEDSVRAFAFHTPVPPVRDPDIELYEDDGRVLDCQGCEIVARKILDFAVTRVIVRPGAWSTCSSCGTQTTVLP